jgi:hypothetical protein
MASGVAAAQAELSAGPLRRRDGRLLGLTLLLAYNGSISQMTCTSTYDMHGNTSNSVLGTFKGLWEDSILSG